MNNAPVRFASRRRFVEIVRALLADERVNPAALNNYALDWAVYGSCSTIVRMLLKDARVTAGLSSWRKWRYKYWSWLP